MDPDMMYDEFGNYIGPELESDEEDEDSADEQENFEEHEQGNLLKGIFIWIVGT